MPPSITVQGFACSIMHQSCALISISLKDLWKRRLPLLPNLKYRSIIYNFFSCVCYHFRSCISLNTLGILSIFASHIWDRFQRVFYSIFVNSQENKHFSCSARRKDKVQIKKKKQSAFPWGAPVMANSRESALFLISHYIKE